MRVQAGDGERHVTIKDVYAKPTSELAVPVRDIDTLESITLGFRQEMLDVKDADGNGGEISTAAGWGGEAITLEWQDGDEKKIAVVMGSDLLAAWVETFDKNAAAGIREAAASWR